MAENPNPVEDLGYAFVQRVAAEAGAIWRRQAEKDLGVDGHIQLRRRDGADIYIAVQVKSGRSYFRRSREGKTRVYLGDSLRRLHRLILPKILVLYDPVEQIGYWESVDGFISDNAEALGRGFVDVRLSNVFDIAAVNELRQDTRLIRTPRLSAHEVDSFLECNRSMSLAAFVALASSVLNDDVIRSRTVAGALKLLLESGLIQPIDLGVPEILFWEPTELGRRYVLFLLGDRYALPFPLLEPKREITGKEVYICMHLEEHLSASGREPVKGLR